MNATYLDMKLESAAIWIYLLGVVGVCLGLSAYSQQQSADGRVDVSEFRMRETDHHGQRCWELYGATARATGPVAVLQDVEVKLFSRDKDGEHTTIITSPRAEFHQDTRLIQSKAPLTVDNAAFSLQGTGYDIFIDKERIFIHNDVHMRIYSTHNWLDNVKTPVAGENSKPASRQED